MARRRAAVPSSERTATVGCGASRSRRWELSGSLRPGFGAGSRCLVTLKVRGFLRKNEIPMQG